MESQAVNQEERSPLGSVLALAIALYAAWTLLTWLLEGRPRTLLRPEAMGLRLGYAAVVNILVGIVGSAAVLFALLERGVILRAHIGLRSARRTAGTIAIALLAGAAFFLMQRPASTEPMVLINAFAQVLVVSIAEVLVCWAVAGNVTRALAARAFPPTTAVVAAVLVAAVLFGIYHFAHSPPFDTLRMVLLLTAVGVVTGAFYFGTAELYGTIVFHNMLALKGVTDALAAGGALDRFAAPQPPILLTALAALTVLMIVDRRLRRAGS